MCIYIYICVYIYKSMIFFGNCWNVWIKWYPARQFSLWGVFAKWSNDLPKWNASSTKVWNWPWSLMSWRQPEISWIGQHTMAKTSLHAKVSPLLLQYSSVISPYFTHLEAIKHVHRRNITKTGEWNRWFFFSSLLRWCFSDSPKREHEHRKTSKEPIPILDDQGPPTEKVDFKEILMKCFYKRVPTFQVVQLHW